ncbi:MAG: hypothetical protein FJW20_14990 [Acidimicrobiia bacterium]|nr:hypothetical protein [Acidimicrobiia bacterium]
MWGHARTYYEAPGNRIMAAAYRVAGGSFAPDKPRLWSDKQFAPAAQFSNFDIAPDGRRFAVLMGAEQGDASRQQVTFLFHFFDELSRKVPPGGR